MPCCSPYGFFVRFSSSSVKRELLDRQTSYAVVRAAFSLHLVGSVCACVYISAFTVCVLNCLGCAFVDCYFWKEVSAVSEGRRKVVQGRLTMYKGRKEAIVVCFDVPCFISALSVKNTGLKHAKDLL